MGDGKCETVSREEILADASGLFMNPHQAYNLKAFTLGHRLLALADDQSEWSQKTFGTDHERGPVGAWRHLQKEAGETIEAWETMRALLESDDPSSVVQADKVAEEQGDMLLLWLDGCRRSGLTPSDVIQAAQAKMAVNRTRVYKRTPDGVPAEHDRSGEQSTAPWWKRFAAGVWSFFVAIDAWNSRRPGLLYLLGSAMWLTTVLLILFAR